MSKNTTPALTEPISAALAVTDGVVISDPVTLDTRRSDLKRKTARGAMLSTGSQVATLLLRTGSMVILARLLVPEDFGLVGMVAAFTGFLGLFKDGGLSMATVQRASITDAQSSTLFWINLAVGATLGVICAFIAPILVAFYGEPRLFWITVASALGFVFNGAAWQHRAMLQRSMHFGKLACIDIVSLLISIAMAVATALLGYGYWALVVMPLGLYATHALAVWFALGWIPKRPERGSGVKSMLRYGGTVTLNNLIVYLAYNADKVLLGRFRGAEVLGIYSRAYQLINLPIENLNSTIGAVAFPALSRVQDDPPRLRRYFLRGYSLFLSLAMPITMGCALFAEDIILVFLGPKWHESAAIFRLMAPTIVAFALINPFAWLMLAIGGAGRSLRIALLIAPVVVLSYVLGLKNGPRGVALGFSIAMIVLVVPVVAWAKHGTLITLKDIIKAILPSFLSIMAGALAILSVKNLVFQINPAFPRLVVASTILFGVYLIFLLFVMRQHSIYFDLMRETGLWPFGKRRKKEGTT